MNILIVYYSESGNTRKVAEAMASNLTSAPDVVVDLRPIDQINPAGWESYDLILVGTPAISGGIAEPVRKVFENLVADGSRPVFKLALFITYGVPDIHFYGNCIDQVKSYCKQLNVEYMNEYCCRGEHRCIDRLAKKFPDKVHLAQTSVGHPNSEDLQKAVDFAVDIYGKALD